MKTEQKVLILGIWTIVIMTICIISGIFETKEIETCKSLRIRDFKTDDFTLVGIAKEFKEGTYQPKCL